MKTHESVKEKAMQKLKEVKSKSEDSGSKARHYLDGLLKIPFGIYNLYKLVLGEVAERLKALVLKTSNGVTRSWVRIPPSPP